jgi:hypothetical protein
MPRGDEPRPAKRPAKKRRVDSLPCVGLDPRHEEEGRPSRAMVAGCWWMTEAKRKPAIVRPNTRLSGAGGGGR